MVIQKEKAPGDPGAFSVNRLFEVAVLLTGAGPGLATAAAGAAFGSRGAAVAALLQGALAAACVAGGAGDRQVGVGGVGVYPRVEGIRACRRARGAALI